MSDIQIVTNDNFVEFLNIIEQRGETPSDYYRWKFLGQVDTNNSIGFIAKENSQTLGCIGLMNYQMHLPGQEPLQTNWCADIYVTNLARGKGIAKKLVKAGADAAAISLCVLVPIAAQKVAEDVGYYRVAGFVELQIPIRPTAVGWKRYEASLVRKGLRSMKFNFAYLKYIAFRKRKSIVLEWEKPTVEMWSDSFTRILNQKTHLIREKARLVHFLEMPISKNREWWYYETENCFVTGYIETDLWGLRRAKIIDLICDELENSMVFMGVLAVLRKNKVDLALMISTEEHFKTMKIKKSWGIEVPFYQTIKNKTRLDYLSNLDKESAWRDFRNLI